MNGSLDLSNNAINNVGAAGNDWTANALSLHGGSSQQAITIQTDGSSSNALQIFRIPAAGTGDAIFRIAQGSGNGDADNMQYDIGYSGASGRLFLRSEDTDGTSRQGDVLRVVDGTDDVAFLGGVGIGASTAPDSGLNMNNNSINNVGAAGNNWSTNALSSVNASGSSDMLIRFGNTTDAAGADARVTVDVGGASAGDAFYRATVTGVTTWSWGVDNSDSDAFVISKNGTLGTNNFFTIDTSGEVCIGTGC